MNFVDFTMIPMWVSICLGLVNLSYTKATMKIPKVFGELQNIIDTYRSILRASPPDTCKRPFS